MSLKKVSWLGLVPLLIGTFVLGVAVGKADVKNEPERNKKKVEKKRVKQ